jgi:glycosyltransferase involved in cell wall biosynthesis
MGRPLSSDQWQDVSGIDLFESAYKLEWMEDSADDVSAAGTWLKKIEHSLGPDLIHFNHYFHASSGWSVPVVTVCHSCVGSWWQAVKDEKVPAHLDGYSESVRSGLQCSDLVVAPTRSMLACAERLYGPFDRSTVIPNGRDLRRFAPAEKENIIFAAGRIWDEAKNLRLLAEIAPTLPWPVRLAGEGEISGTNLQALGRITADQVAREMSRASIYALLALYEPFGLSVLEAAASGCALVLGDIPSLRENWEGAAVFVDPHSPEDCKQALIDVIEDCKRRAELAHEAIARSVNFGIAPFVDAYERAYRELLGVHHPGKAVAL